jgi:hypothetical protein
MTALSTAAWTAHEVGLATAIGGTLYGRAAMRPALEDITDPENRDLVSAGAWRRFSWLNLAAHGVFAATWFVGRSMLSGREVSGAARSLTRMKDGLVVASLVTGIGSTIVGRALGKQISEGDGAQATSGANRAPKDSQRTQAMRRAASGLGIANLLANIAILGITTMLAMEGSRSARFAARSRLLP